MRRCEALLRSESWIGPFPLPPHHPLTLSPDKHTEQTKPVETSLPWHEHDVWKSMWGTLGSASILRSSPSARNSVLKEGELGEGGSKERVKGEDEERK